MKQVASQPEKLKHSQEHICGRLLRVLGEQTPMEICEVNDCLVENILPGRMVLKSTHLIGNSQNNHEYYARFHFSQKIIKLIPTK